MSLTYTVSLYGEKGTWRNGYRPFSMEAQDELFYFCICTISPHCVFITPHQSCMRPSFEPRCSHVRFSEKQHCLSLLDMTRRPRSRRVKVVASVSTLISPSARAVRSSHIVLVSFKSLEWVTLNCESVVSRK